MSKKSQILQALEPLGLRSVLALRIPQKGRNFHDSSFFLLIGILVILTIMVLLSGIALPYYIGHIETAKVRKAGQETKILAQTAKAYYRDNRDSPNVL